MTKTCVSEPVFDGRVCVYQMHRTAPQTVVLVHGINGRATRDWQQQFHALASRYHVLALDLPGFGDSTRAAKPYSPETYARLLHFVAGRFASKPFYLVGHSMGGAIAIHYAATYPGDVRRLVLVDVAGILQRLAYSKFLAGAWASGAPRDGPHGPDNVVARLTGKILEGLARMGLAPNPHGGDTAEGAPVLDDDPAAIAGLALADYDASHDLQRIHVPTTLIWGGDDHVAALRTGYVLHRLIAGSKLKVIPGVEHVPMRQSAETFNGLLLKALTEPAGDFKSQPAAASRPVPPGERVGVCRDQKGMRFEGAYERIELRHCAGVLIKDVTVSHIEAFESRARIVDTDVSSEATALSATGSDLEITASRFSGKVAISASRSSLDIAGSSLRGTSAAVRSATPSNIIFSVSRLDSPYTQGWVHRYVTVSPRHPL